MDRKLWEPLLRFESRDYVTRHYKEKHGRSLNAKRAYEIGSCFTQGREYFASASTASDTVKPLLLYYGVASLSRGVTLLKDRTKNEESLTPRHGLSAVNWAKTLHAGISEVLNLEVRCEKGGFTEFVTSVGNRQSYTWLHRRKESGRLVEGHFSSDFGTIRLLDDNSSVSLGDLLSREKELATEYRIAAGKWGNTDLGSVVASDASVRVHLHKIEGSDLESAIKSYRFPETAKFTIEADPRYSKFETICVEIPVVGEERKKVVPMAAAEKGALSTLVRPFPNGDKIIDIHRVYLEAYILGMLCRYFPSKWMSLLRSDKGDIARSLVLAAMARIEAKFPLLVRGQP